MSENLSTDDKMMLDYRYLYIGTTTGNPFAGSAVESVCCGFISRGRQLVREK